MGKIANAKNELQAIVEEVQALENEYNALRREIIGLQNATTPEQLERRKYLGEAADLLYNKLPRTRGLWSGPGRNPQKKLEYDVVRAESKIGDLERQAQAIQNEVADVERLMSKMPVGKAQQLINRFEDLRVLFRDTGMYPTLALDDRSWLVLVLWARGIKDKMDKLPMLKKKLATY